MIIATAGHVDHGKTALIKSLTGVDTDRLPEEKKRGISIDLGFAYLRTPGDNITIGFVDVPGHEHFVRNMLAGVCAIDCVLFVVAADDGVMPQTIEHLHIIELLSVRRGIAVISKIDRVSTLRVQEIAAGVRALLATTCLARTDVIPVSVVTGEGVGAVREALAACARSLVRQKQEGRFFRFCIDRAFSVAGSGTVVTGTAFSGAVAIGDRLTLTPGGIQVRVRGIQKDGHASPQAAAGERCALNLADLALADAARGDWVVAPQLHAPTRRMDVRLRLLGTEARPLRHWTPVHLHHGAGDVTARVALRGNTDIQPGQEALAQLIVDQPVAALHGDRFIIRDQSAVRTIGGGRVVDPFAPRRGRDHARRAAQLGALEEADPAEALRRLLAVSPSGVDMRWFGRSFNLDDDQLERLARSSGMVVLGKEPSIGVPRSSVEEVRRRVMQAVTEFHAEAPQALGIEIAALRKRCAPDQTAATFQILLRGFADEKHIEITGSGVRLPRHVATDNPADERMWKRVHPPLEAAGFGGLTLAELASAAGINEAQLKDFLFRKAKTGEVLRVTQERFYLRGTLARFAAIAEGVSRSLPGGKFTAAQVRDRTDIGRTRVIEILECLDRLGITMRVGDLRTMRKDFAPILGAPR